MKLRNILALLLALLLLNLPVLAEESAEAVAPEDLIGLWVMEDDARCQLQIVPGSYAPLTNKANFPELYGDGRWQDSDAKWVNYQLMIKRSDSYKPGLLEKLGVNPTIARFASKMLSRTEVRPDLFKYDNSGIFAVDDRLDADTFTYTTNASGLIFANRREDGSIVLEWIDETDPHVYGIRLNRVVTEAPSAEELTGKALRPVIDRTTGAEVQAALEIAQYAVEARLGTADAAAFKENLDAAIGGLSDADRQALAEGFAVIGPMLRDALELDYGNYTEERYAPFEALGLQEEISAIFAGDTIDRYSAGLLCSALGKRTGK